MSALKKLAYQHTPSSFVAFVFRDLVEHGLRKRWAT
jgi:hypothetical protein